MRAGSNGAEDDLVVSPGMLLQVSIAVLVFGLYLVFPFANLTMSLSLKFVVSAGNHLAARCGKGETTGSAEVLADVWATLCQVHTRICSVGACPVRPLDGSCIDHRVATTLARHSSYCNRFINVCHACSSSDDA